VTTEAERKDLSRCGLDLAAGTTLPIHLSGTFGTSPWQLYTDDTLFLRLREEATQGYNNHGVWTRGVDPRAPRDQWRAEGHQRLSNVTPGRAGALWNAQDHAGANTEPQRLCGALRATWCGPDGLTHYFLHLALHNEPVFGPILGRGSRSR
jgi:hypothetical protein